MYLNKFNLETTNDFLDDDESWYTRLENTKWLRYVSVILEYTNKCINCLNYQRINIYIEESMSKDISCVLASLMKIILFKKYRTIAGFQNLIQKEWFLAGHMFSKRSNLVNSNCTFKSFLKAVSIAASGGPAPSSNDSSATESTSSESEHNYIPIFMKNILMKNI